MAKNKIVISAISVIVFLFILSFGFVWLKKPKEEKEFYYLTPTITKVYCKQIKSFPAPYELVGGLPRI